jgi:hypothetical protein
MKILEQLIKYTYKFIYIVASLDCACSRALKKHSARSTSGDFSVCRTMYRQSYFYQCIGSNRMVPKIQTTFCIQINAWTWCRQAVLGRRGRRHGRRHGIGRGNPALGGCNTKRAHFCPKEYTLPVCAFAPKQQLYQNVSCPFSPCVLRAWVLCQVGQRQIWRQ